MTVLNVVVPIEVTRGQNNREHHFTRSKRVKAEREATHLALLDHASAIAHELIDETGLGARVTLLRPFARIALDTDNLSGAFKGVRDEVASFLGVDDKSERVHWRYCQTKATNDKAPWCKKKRDTHIRIRIEIVPASDVDPMLTAVRVLRDVAREWIRSPVLNARYVEPRADLDSDTAKALATADALASFDASEMYQSR